MVHCMLSIDMKNLLTMLMRGFLIPAVVDEEIVKYLIHVDVKDPINQLQLFKMDFGLEVKVQVID